MLVAPARVITSGGNDMSIHGPQWDRDEEFRQSVIRKAMLLGFECEEHPVSARPYQHNTTRIGQADIVTEWRWRFTLESETYTGYASIYSAAYEFLRLQGLSHLAGDYRG